MTHRQSIKALSSNVSDLADRISDLRDEFAALDGADPEARRFGQLSDAEDNLFNLGEVLFAYLAMPTAGDGIDQAVLMVAESSIQNASILVEIVSDELSSLKGVAHGNPA